MKNPIMPYKKTGEATCIIIIDLLVVSDILETGLEKLIINNKVENFKTRP